MTRAMWRELRERLRASCARQPALRCVVVGGEGGAFCAGGDISEYPSFRFEADAAARLPRGRGLGGAGRHAGLRAAAGGAASRAPAWAPGSRSRAAATSGWPANPRSSAPRSPSSVFRWRRARRRWCRRGRRGAGARHAAGGQRARRRAPARRRLPAARAARRRAPGRTCWRHAQSHCRAGARGRAPQQGHLLAACERAVAQAGVAPLLATAYDYADTAEHREGIAAFLAKRPPVF